MNIDKQINLNIFVTLSYNLLKCFRKCLGLIPSCIHMFLSATNKFEEEKDVFRRGKPLTNRTKVNIEWARLLVRFDH